MLVILTEDDDGHERSGGRYRPSGGYYRRAENGLADAHGLQEEER